VKHIRNDRDTRGEAAMGMSQQTNMEVKDYRDSNGIYALTKYKHCLGHFICITYLPQTVEFSVNSLMEFVRGRVEKQTQGTRRSGSDANLASTCC
jgi:hypothetical protein